MGLEALPDGSLVVADANASRIRKIDPQGIITTLAGSGYCASTPAELGDGGPSTAARVCQPYGLASGPDGSLYIADRAHHRVRKIDPQGIITTVAGTGTGGFSGDGGPATQAKIGYPLGVAMGPDGSLFITDSYRIRRVDTNGVISTYAGKGTALCYGWWAGGCGDGGLATEADLYGLTDVAVGPDGTVYASQSYIHRIRRVTPDGKIDTFAGVYYGQGGYSGEGVPAAASRIMSPTGMKVAPNGDLLFAESTGHRVRRVSADGLIYTVAGTGLEGPSGDGGAALAARLKEPSAVAIGPQGDVYVDGVQHVRKVKPPMPGLALDQIAVPSSDGSELYVMDAHGRHLRTLDALTGTTRLTFAYEDGKLVSLTDANGQVTAVQRNGAGEPTAIVAPFGQTTTLELGTSGANPANPANPTHRLIQSIQAPDGATWAMTYDPAHAGQLASFTTPRQQTTHFVYDDWGRVLRDQSPDGSRQDLARTGWAWDYEVTRTTRLGRQTRYAVTRQNNGDRVHTHTFPDAGQSLQTVKPDGTRVTVLADGTTLTSKTGPDARFGMTKPRTTETKVTLPSGLTSTTTHAQTATLSNPSDPLTLVTMTDTTTVNGRSFTSTWSAATRTWTHVTPAGRSATVTLDEKGRVVHAAPPGILPTQLTYDPQGRIAALAQGTRQQTFGYDAQTGYLLSVTDAANQQTLFERDAVGRTTRQTLPDTSAIDFAYDASGNMTWLTPPGKPSHGMQHTPVDLLASYDPPAVSGSGATSTTYGYNLDRQLESVLRPDGLAIGRTYDPTTGKLASLALPTGTATYGYHPVTGKLASISGPYGVSLAYAYDGSLKTEETWSGAISGAVQTSYDNDFRVVNETVNGGHAVSFGYDTDGLLTNAGALTRAFDPATAQLASTTVGTVTEAYGYDAYGELESVTNPLLSVGYVRDALGRIVEKTETAGGETHVFAYRYDLRGRLVEVKRDGVVVEAYAHDAAPTTTRIGCSSTGRRRIPTRRTGSLHPRRRVRSTRTTRRAPSCRWSCRTVASSSM
jgi:YD repeat-containing protein